VTFLHLTSGGQLDNVTVKYVFVCGVPSTRRSCCLDAATTTGLYDLCDQLGYHYWGNGDFLAFAFDTAESFFPNIGPTITTGVRV
jgi:hypothetical protein